MSTSAAAPPPQSDLLTEKESAEYLRSNPRTLERWRTIGQGPLFVKVGRRVYYRRAALDAYLDARSRQHTNQNEHTAA